MQIINFPEGGGDFESDEKLLFALSAENWHSPFKVLVTQGISPLADYLVTEWDTFDDAIQDDKMNWTFTNHFTVPANQDTYQWLLSTHNLTQQSLKWLLSSVTVKFL
ncbi:MAG: hypothetical protein UT55_C0050G0002 [Candidatus Peregrinibacteria bacterium GW2011_GWE2_39_6]|nr:MAG: hypothetical protein UT55_C0050G0002 [Candidatus Peregrinibacteria bacterium GW2011_GWE2_39_6]